ncbi:DNA mismatch repair protein MutS isoform X2 [Nematostella vectensis]|uniref:DNA mismatch repair protein MutS isoform X2 n=1 Tax=Nematostella vectensis TaxID=45351 RepID=UPI001390144E|nr:DNA mismatch repair protein MutS isoform X2 [Nematostella vectensis]
MAGVITRSSFYFLTELTAERVQRLLSHTRMKEVSRICKVYFSSDTKPAAKTNNLLCQYNEIKKRYPEFVVLFQVGDFYEIYGKDAIDVSQKLSLRLTKSATVSKLMAGFPVRSLNSWLTPLVQHGFQIAISQQIPEKTSKSSKLIHRDVVRLVTPGTVLEPLEPDANYLLSLTRGPGGSLGVAWVDISTGEFHLATSTLDTLEEDLTRINPAEILITARDMEEANPSPNYKVPKKLSKPPLSCVEKFHVTTIPEEWFDNSDPTSQNNIKHFLSTNTANFSSIELCAGVALLNFLSYTQKDVTPILNKPSQYNHQTHMAIDSNTRRSLELTEPLMNSDKKATLFGVMNTTCTHAGRRLLHARICAPSTQVHVIQSRLNSVEMFYNDRHLNEEVRQCLKRCPDIERTLQKVATSMAGLADLRLIRDSIIIYSNIRDLLRSSIAHESISVIGLLRALDYEAMEGLRTKLEQAVGHVESVEASVLEGYSDEADEIRAKIGENEQQVKDLMESYRSLLNIPKLTISPHRAFIRVVEIPSSKEAVMADREDFVRVDGVTGKVRYSTLRLQELNAELKSLQEHHERTQKALSNDLCHQVTRHADQLRQLARTLAEIDVASSLGLLALTRGYTKPKIVTTTDFRVSGGRHPVVDLLRPDSFVCNDCDLSKKRVWIVTGPNMGGKSTFLRQNALIAILAQAGSYVPAQQATVGIVDRLFARIGASDNLVQHQSTFMSEMLETAYILTNATEKSLVLIDEIGRGTSMLDGMSIAWAVTEHLHDVIRCRTLASTHFHQLARLTQALPAVACYHVTALLVDEGITFTFKVMHGTGQHSFGIDVARLAGIPKAVEARAREIARPFEKPSIGAESGQEWGDGEYSETSDGPESSVRYLRQELSAFDNIEVPTCAAASPHNTQNTILNHCNPDPLDSTIYEHPNRGICLTNTEPSHVLNTCHNNGEEWGELTPSRDAYGTEHPPSRHTDEVELVHSCHANGVLIIVPESLTSHEAKQIIVKAAEKCLFK